MLLGSPLVLGRLTRALWNRKVAVFVKSEEERHIKNILVQSELFKDKNIQIIGHKDDITRAESKAIFLVHWSDFGVDIKQIIARMDANAAALVVYAPDTRLQREDLEQINSAQNATLTNFRGRLLNDIFLATLTSKG